MLAVLDSQCKFPRATDATLHMQLLEALTSRSHFGTNPRVPGSFIIRHYAGAVHYDTTGLLDKNKDTLSIGTECVRMPVPITVGSGKTREIVTTQDVRCPCSQLGDRDMKSARIASKITVDICR